MRNITIRYELTDLQHTIIIGGVCAVFSVPDDDPVTAEDITQSVGGPIAAMFGHMGEGITGETQIQVNELLKVVLVGLNQYAQQHNYICFTFPIDVGCTFTVPFIQMNGGAQ